MRGRAAVRVNEIFYTIQGEGRAMGLPTVFLRTTGCHLRCTWCDTTYSFYEGQELALEDALDRVAKFPARRLCLTGGEPLLQRDAVAFVRALLDKGWHVTIETSGSLPLDELATLQPRGQLVLSVDVKPPGSGMEAENHWPNLALLEPHDQLKLVIANEEDYAYARRVLASHPTRAEVIFQACWSEGSSNLAWLADRVLRDGLDVRVGTQLHKHIWGEERAR
jgi:7-carboxy-7-deazaguanine synthase